MRNLKVMSLVILLAVSFGLVYATAASVLTRFNIEPNPMEKATTIYLSFSKEVNVDISVETLDGEIVKTVYSGRLNAGDYEYAWDRSDNMGEYVIKGTYNLVVNYGLRYTSTKKTLILK